MALKIIDFDTPEYRQMLKMREEILRKPLGLSFTESEIEKEKDNLLIAAFEDEQMLGCCMIVEMDPRKARLRQMAVLNNLQGKGIGRALIQFAENLARDHGYRILEYACKKTYCSLFEKMGYKIHGPEFIEITIPHYEMIKEL
jgi:N-acetylglutamate synthase-like GNAT family acetyltransferase